MKETIELGVNEHKNVGPYPDLYGHGPVTLLVPDEEKGAELFICLDCGYTTDLDIQLAHVDCDESENTITQTWREWFDAEDADSLPDPDPDGDWPIDE